MAVIDLLWGANQQKITIVFLPTAKSCGDVILYCPEVVNASMALDGAR